MEIVGTKLHQFIKEVISKGVTCGNEDLVAIFLPLIETVCKIHNNGKVSQLNDFNQIIVAENYLDINEVGIEITTNVDTLNSFFTEKFSGLEVTENIRHKIEIGDDYTINMIDNSSDDRIRPDYLQNYQSYELLLGHHDPLTDIYLIGILMASIAYSFDFCEQSDVDSFAQYRKNMVFNHPRIHPALANLIYGMTELDRRKRWKDINEVKEKLKNYFDYNPDIEYDLSELVDSKSKNRNQFIHEKLRNRLFDDSKRNRLIYYQPNLKFLNLTISSVPQVIDYRNLNEKNLFYWNKELSKSISNNSTISLNKFLQFSDNTYIVPSLDKIRLESNKDKNEYGFSQLKLVLCFINWYNTKENSKEKIMSPLLLISVNLVKEKGVKDQYKLEFFDSEIEVNPILSNKLNELYGIKLPESFSLNEIQIEEIYQSLKNQIGANGSGIDLIYNDKPKIKLIHSIATKTLTQYNKKYKNNKAIKESKQIDYSYQVEDFRPLGLEMYKKYVKIVDSTIEHFLNDKKQQNQFHFSDNNTIEKDFYTLDDGQNNPYQWEFDTCNMVLGNFNYKKMSLVRDYNAIIDNDIQSSIFDHLFSPLKKDDNIEEFEEDNLFTEVYNIVQSDSTQNKAVKYSETGKNYIIQGPPGTGKSQTIANLIANYVARGKKVLFVCEKRAALDVVYHRLKNQNLESLCCLIHDSQSDKKEFIQDLKINYLKFSKGKSLHDKLMIERTVIVNELKTELSKIEVFHHSMNHVLDGTNLTIRDLFDIESKNQILKVGIENYELDEKASYKDWTKFSNEIFMLFELNKESNQIEYYSQHPFHLLQNKVFAEFNQTQFNETLNSIIKNIEMVDEKLSFISLPMTSTKWIDLIGFFSQINQLFLFYFYDCIELLDLFSNKYKKLIEDKNLLNRKLNELNQLNKIYPYWTRELSESDVVSSLEIMSKYESRFFRFLYSKFKNTDKVLKTHYQLLSHSIKPKWLDVLKNKENQFKLIKEIEDLNEKFENTYHTKDLDQLINLIKEINQSNFTEPLTFIKQFKGDELKELMQLTELVTDTQKKISMFLYIDNNNTIVDIEKKLDQLKSKNLYFQKYKLVFSELSNINESVLRMIKYNPLSIIDIECILAHKSIQDHYSKHYIDQYMNQDVLDYLVKKIENLYNRLLEINGKMIVESQKFKFKKLIELSETSVAGMSDDDKQLKKKLIEAKKILENEFSKSMRYKSIRDLSTNDSSLLIKEIKPVWLMSPLSVSDALPLNQDNFDVVIFDEASQITIEEGLPPIYRAKQSIVVGDEMQMPPSNFFGSNSSQQDDIWHQETGYEFEPFSLDADSFLVQGSRKFPSLMLGWHYRSKHESLIGFSNATFYNNKLLTIPDLKDNQNNKEEIVIKNSNSMQNIVSLIREKPISYHYVENGIYSQRTNVKEAEYIALLVKELLSENSGESIGIVAFSMEQQEEIEEAIEALCQKDKYFENTIEEEFKRVENNQFVGLFIKNLENVQGDERDIIIISTCYGYDNKGKMLMNFGPINKRGGEKRLNVLFSRAKKNMCVVSSIKYFDIKNEYNEGANCLRKYLQYAELVSKGEIILANQVLLSIHSKPNNVLKNKEIVNQISAFLESKGFYVNKLIGQSEFKCHIGVKLNQIDSHYKLGILLDDDHHYKNKDILEQYLLKLGVMKSQGWNICQVFAKDWCRNRDFIENMLLTKLSNNVNDTILNEITNDPIPKDETLIDLNDEPIFSFTNLLFKEEDLNKFWKIAQNENQLIIEFGKVGNKSQRLIKKYENAEEASKQRSKLIEQKIKIGYELVV